MLLYLFPTIVCLWIIYLALLVPFLSFQFCLERLWYDTFVS